MLNQVRIKAARFVAGVLLASHLLGVVWFLSTLSAVRAAHAAIVIAALAAFCFIPRSELHRVWRYVAMLAVLAGVSTLLVAWQNLFLIGGADYGALVGRLLVLAVLAVMVSEAVLYKGEPDAADALAAKRRREV